MQDIILAGSGGCMRELIWQIQELNKEIPSWNVVGYVDCRPPKDGVGVYVGDQLIKYLGDDSFLVEHTEDVNVAVCVGETKLRRKIVAKYVKNKYIHFPSLILSNTCICGDVKVGQGCIISMDVRISTNVTLGDFVFLNTGAKVLHDGRVGSFVTLSPDAELAGAVTIGNDCEVGLGAKIIQGITIGENSIIGAGAVVVRDIIGNCTAVGVPAHIIKVDKC